MESHLILHNEALEIARNHRRTEAELIDILQRIDRQKTYENFNCKTLHDYAVTHLQLSRDQAYYFVKVARKCVDVPELKKAIEAQAVTVSMAKRIITVIEKENSEEWISKASTLKQRALEIEVAKVDPKALLPERTRVITEELVEKRFTMTMEEEKLLKRILDIESQRLKKNVTLQEYLASKVKEDIKKNDPIEKAKRNIGKKVALRLKLGRHATPAQVRHAVTLRDQGKCVECDQSRWTELHHLKLVSQGGQNIVSNLVTLCHFHHRKRHG